MKRQIGEQITERRRELGLTQQEVADRIGVHYSFVSLLEHGKRDPSLSTLQDIASALKTRLEVKLVRKGVAR